MSDPSRQAGDRGPRVARGDAKRRVRAAAIGVIEKYGVAGFSFREVAKDEKLGVTRGTPLYHFGTLAGLLGAVAEDGFRALGKRLGRERPSQATSIATLERMAAQHVRFALRKPKLYEAIHSPGLWTATQRVKPKPE